MERRTVLMGIVNVTPDSFYDGGRRFDPAKAVADGIEMVEAWLSSAAPSPQRPAR